MSVSIRNLNIVIDGMPIVHDVDMDIADGERVGLIGSSGSGKSMIAKSIMGLLPLSAQVSGSIDMGGTEIVGASDQAIADLRGRYVGMVFQNPSAALNPVMTVAQQVALPLRLHYDLTRDERLDRVKAMFAKVGLPEDVLNKYLHMELGKAMSLSGMCVALSAALVYDKKTVVLSILGTYFNGIVLDHFIFDHDMKRRVCIITEKEEELRRFIIEDLHSGATIYESIGAYNMQKRNEIIAIVDKVEYQKLMNYISREDPHAFITVYTVSDIRYQPKRQQ